MRILPIVVSVLLFALTLSCRELPTFEANPVDPISSEFQVAPPTSVNVLVIDARGFGGTLDYRLIWNVPIVKPYGVFNGVEIQRFNFDTDEYQDLELFDKQTFFLQIPNIQNEKEQFRVRTFFADVDIDTVYSQWVESDVITKADAKIEQLFIGFLNSSDAKLIINASDVSNDLSTTTIDLEKKVNNGSYSSVTQVDVETELFWDEVDLSLGDSITYRARISNDSNNTEFFYSNTRTLEFDLGAPQYATVYEGMDSIYVHFEEFISADAYRVILRDNNESIVEDTTVYFKRNTHFSTAFGDLDSYTEPFNLELFLLIDGQESDRVEYFTNIFLDR